MSRVLSLAGAMVWVFAGCQQLPADSLVNADDVTIRLAQINPIVQSQTLTEAEKQQQLQDLGITDPDLINALIQGGGVGG